MKMEMERKNIQSQNRCVEAAKEHPNLNKHPKAIRKIISQIIQLLLIMWSFKN